MGNLADTYPELVEEELHSLMLSDSPGYLGLNLPLEIAKKLTWQLKYTKAKAACQIIPIQYRDNEPKYTVKTAYPIAEKELKNLQATKYPGLHFSKLVYGAIYSTIMYIAFVSSVKEWQDKDLIPGALFINVDRLDGHLWAEGEGDEIVV